MRSQRGTTSIRQRYARGGPRILFCVMLSLMSAVVLRPESAAMSSGPCDAAPDWGGGGLPPTPPEPTFEGSVSDLWSAAPVVGAEVKIFKCSSSGPALIDTAATGPQGEFEFTSLQPDAGHGYYLELRVDGELEETSLEYGIAASQGVNLAMLVDG